MQWTQVSAHPTAKRKVVVSSREKKKKRRGGESFSKANVQSPSSLQNKALNLKCPPPKELAPSTYGTPVQDSQQIPP